MGYCCSVASMWSESHSFLPYFCPWLHLAYAIVIITVSYPIIFGTLWVLEIIPPYNNEVRYHAVRFVTLSRVGSNTRTVVAFGMWDASKDKEKDNTTLEAYCWLDMNVRLLINIPWFVFLISGILRVLISSENLFLLFLFHLPFHISHTCHIHPHSVRIHSHP